MKNNIESKARKEVRIMMESLHEEKTKNGTFLNIKVIKYYSKEKEESEVAKPRFSFNRNSV